MLPQLVVKGDKKNEKILIRLPLEVDGQKVSGYPEPPLEFSARLAGKTYDFTHEVDRLVSARNVKTMQNYIKALSNQRNRILYASQGLPVVDPPIESYLARQLENVFRIITIYLLIDPYPEKQSFVTQCLQAFLRMIGKIPDAAT